MKKRIGWGLFFIVAAVILIASGMGWIPKIHFFTLLMTVFFLAILVEGLVHLEWGGIFFSLAFLAIIYAKPLGITAITPWPVLGAALLGTIGFSMIFKKNHHNGTSENHFSTEEAEQVAGGNITMKTSFGSSIKYINTDVFEYALVDCSFGAMKIYFDNATMKNGSADIMLDVSFSGVELYIPKTWTVDLRAKASFGGIEFKNRCESLGAPVLRINGEASFSGVTIYYV